MRLLALLAVLLAAGPVRAAHVFLDHGNQGVILLEGRIEPGDADKFARFMRGAGPAIHTLQLRSPGGNAAEAIKIGALVRRLMLRTEAPTYEGGEARCAGLSRHCVCASACFFVWAAGIHRNADAHLEVHRPAAPDGADAEDPEDVDAKVTEYLTSLEIPSPFISLVLLTTADRLETAPPALVRSAGGFAPSVEAILRRFCPEPRQNACSTRVVAELRRISHEKLREEDEKHQKEPESPSHAPPPARVQ